MLVKEEKILMDKVTVAVGNLLDRHSDKWTAREISEVSKVSQTRLTEYRNFEKYQRRITVNHLVKLIGEGFLMVEEIIAVAVDLSDAEKKHLREMNFYENTSLRKLVVKNKQNGIDPIELNALCAEISMKGIDVMEFLRRLKENS